MATELYGLVLTGGASSRMGRDKAEIIYGEQPQWRAAADIVAPICARTYWSCTAKQRDDWGIGESGIVDQVPGHGPASGIHAAFLHAPDAAWIVIGCDYPFLETQDIRRLLEARAPGVDAVTFLNHQTAEIDPMISLWEPAAVQHFMQRFAAGEQSTRRILQSCKLVTVMPREQRVLHNRNTPTE
ncbi:MAG: hypothetical protein EBR07_07125 [Planctomycetes bacterium]|nr:hypothetical protein [Planctomycetota bacterium]